MSSTEPSRIYRTRPWLAAKRLEKDPHTRLKEQIRFRLIALVLPVASLPLLLAQGQPLWLVGPGIAAGMVHSLVVLRQLRTRPEIFLQKDAAMRALLADFRAKMASGAWTGAKYRPTWMVTAPVTAIAVGIQPPALLHTSWVLGVIAGGATFVGIVGYNLIKARKKIAAIRARLDAAGLAGESLSRPSVSR